MLICGGNTLLPDGLCFVDVRVVDGKIAQVGSGLTPEPDEEVVDAAGLFVLPGLIDCHTHFGLDTGNMCSLDDFAAGSSAAAAGGVTTYINFAPQRRGQSLVDAVLAERGRAEGHSLVDFALHASCGTPPATWERDLEDLVELGVTSLKVYTTYRDTSSYTRDFDWLQLMQATGELGLLVQVHAENDDIVEGATASLLAHGQRSFRFHGRARPEAAEIAAVGMGIGLCQATGAPIYFVHLSSPDSVALVVSAREAGLSVFAEVCPHHLTLDDSRYVCDDAGRFLVTPPLRAAGSVESLVEAVIAGHVDTAGSDHAAYGLEQRGIDRDFTTASPGLPGVQTLWPILYTLLVAERGMPLERVADMVSRHPAAVFGLAPRKGTITPRADADLFMYDPEPRAKIDEAGLYSRAGYSPWHGAEVQGRVVRTLCRGKTVFACGSLGADLAHGRFVPCSPFAAQRFAQQLPVPVAQE